MHYDDTGFAPFVQDSIKKENKSRRIHDVCTFEFLNLCDKLDFLLTTIYVQSCYILTFTNVTNSLLSLNL